MKNRFKDVSGLRKYIEDGRAHALEFENYLMEKYPRLFPAPPDCGVDIPDGWHYLVDKMCESLNNYLFYKPEIPFQINQLKSKFATLRCYSDGGDKETERVINVAEEESKKICENTGGAGFLHKRGGWVKTLSEEEGIKNGYEKCLP